MVFIFIIILFIAVRKNYKRHSVYECIGALVTHYIPKEIKVRNYKTLRLLRFLKSKKEFAENKNKYVYLKVSAITATVFLIYYIFKFHEKISGIGWVYVIGVIVVLNYLPDYKLSEHVKREKAVINTQLPNFLTKLNLLMGSGMSTISAIKKISLLKRNCFEVAVSKTVLDIDSGNSIEDSFHELSQQCQDSYVTQFVRIIVQDKKYGSKVTISRLETICDEAWKNKKVSILKKGEEASTKLLLPMMISLISILVAVTVPAISQLFYFS